MSIPSIFNLRLKSCNNTSKSYRLKNGLFEGICSALLGAARDHLKLEILLHLQFYWTSSKWNTDTIKMNILVGHLWAMGRKHEGIFIQRRLKLAWIQQGIICVCICLGSNGDQCIWGNLGSTNTFPNILIILYVAL